MTYQHNVSVILSNNRKTRCSSARKSQLHTTQQTHHPERSEGSRLDASTSLSMTDSECPDFLSNVAKEPALSLPKGLDASTSLSMTDSTSRLDYARHDGCIGIFDSGIGGLSVWRNIVHELPHEHTIYLADQAHLPYGPRPLEEIRRYAIAITNFLLEQGAKIIVIACNTASGAALHHLRQTFKGIPFVGMEPAVKPAAEHTRTGVVGVIATPATFQGRLFHKLVERYASEVTLKTQTCPGLVEQIEKGAFDTQETKQLLHSYLDPMLVENIDHLVLGCTHYPFLSETIQEITGPGVTLVDPAPAVARQIGHVLELEGLRVPQGTPPNKQHRLYTTGEVAVLARQAEMLVGYTGPVQAATWEVTGELRRETSINYVEVSFAESTPLKNLSKRGRNRA